MSSRSKLSSICWNNYIKGQIASSNFEGVVQFQIWDMTRNQVYMELKEHERRVWSVDFSWSNPTLVASRSDDSIGTSVGTIKTKAYVCCVQFLSDTGNTLAFGSAHHRVYYYDLRNPGVPRYTLTGHNKTVSYVKFLDSLTLVSSSTDNTLKLWDLSESTSKVIDCPVQFFTGHMNVKLFICILRLHCYRFRKK
ncbi:putative transcription factor WD40-like family [Helianthus debilis subsp. tardiflorus]